MANITNEANLGKADSQAQEIENVQANSGSSTENVLDDKALEGHPAQAVVVHEKASFPCTESLSY